MNISFFLIVGISYGQLPLEYGQAVVTCGTGDISSPAIPGPNEPTIGIRDVRNRPAASTSNWFAPEYHHADWVFGTPDASGKKTDKMGNVFGLCLDDSGNIYVTDYSGYNSINMTDCPGLNANGLGPKGVNPKGFGGPGSVYKIDKSTGAVSLLVSLPNPEVLPMFLPFDNSCKTYTDPYGRDTYIRYADVTKLTGVGLGNIAFDKTNNQLFVTNFEDGRIYRLSTSGNILSTFDPKMADDGLVGMAPIGERVWAVGVYNNRVYYSVWNQEFGTTTQNEIRSVGLNASGDFLIATDQLEFLIPFPSGYTGRNGGDGGAWVADPVSDIEFSHDGKMLIAQKSMVTDISERGHTGRVLKYNWTGSSYTMDTEYFVGAFSSTRNSAGGVDFGYSLWDNSNNKIDTSSREQLIWASGVAIRLPFDCVGSNEYIYGMQSIDIAGNMQGCPAVFTGSNLVDFDGNLTNNTKGYIGDVDVFREEPAAPCSIALTATPGACIPANNQYTLTGQVTFSNPPTSGTLTVSVSGGGSQVFNAPFTSPTNYSLTGLYSDGVSHTVTAIFSADNTCTASQVYTAPVSCAPTCTLSVSCTATPQTNCTPPNGGASVTVSGGQGNITYAWSSGETVSSITGKMAGTYTVTVTDDFLPGCSTTCQAVIANATVNPTCSITANSQPSCANLTGGSITVNPNPVGTYTYNWGDIGAGPAARTGLSGGTYTVTVTNTTTGCTGVCDITLTTPTNCCSISAIVPQNVVCLDNNTPNVHTDNRIRFSALVTNTNASLLTYNVTINGGTTITPNTNVGYGTTQFTLGPGTAGGGATFTVTVTDSVTPGCTQTFQVIDPGSCNNAIPCPTPNCGTATIQVNGN